METPLAPPSPTPTEIPSATPTRTPFPPPTPVVLDPAVDELVSLLSEHGITMRLSPRNFSYQGCLLDFLSDMESFDIQTKPLRFRSGIDLYSFGNEEAASAASRGIPNDCGHGPDWVVELPYFQCNSVIAFVQSTEKGLADAFEELCGPPFAKTQTWIPFSITSVTSTTAVESAKPTRTPVPTSTPIGLDPTVDQVISFLVGRGLNPRFTGLTSSIENCLTDYESSLNSFDIRGALLLPVVNDLICIRLKAN
jgi:hypothetical protein